MESSTCTDNATIVSCVLGDIPPLGVSGQGPSNPSEASAGPNSVGFMLYQLVLQYGHILLSLLSPNILRVERLIHDGIWYSSDPPYRWHIDNLAWSRIRDAQNGNI